ncbi:MAG: haloacid dehalogenase type II [Xanthobacteraceae bacterium]
MTEPESDTTRLSRRHLLVAGTAASAALTTGGAAESATADLSGIKALTFDVQGSSTDFWGTIVREGEAINRRNGLDIDWGKFADDWRGLYRPGLDAVLAGQRPWQSVDSIYREALDRLLRERGITGFSEAELVDLNRVWQRLQPWPDTIPGLTRLKRRYILATLSNADVAALVRMAKHSNLTWDTILAAEMAQTFKPDPKVYQVAVRYLGLQPQEIMMVACHKYDLRGARAQGFRTAFVARPLEFGPAGKVDTQFDAEFDLNVASFVELAERLGA